MLRGSWLNALLAGIALGMSMLPEEFPLVLTVFMVMGAWRMSQARVLTRRAAAIETLGEATVLCTDKTGTLTENRMTVVALHAAGETLDPSGATTLAPPFQHLAVTAALASAPDAYDPMDRAFHDLAGRTDGATAGLSARTRLWAAARPAGRNPGMASAGWRAISGRRQGSAGSDRRSLRPR